MTPPCIVLLCQVSPDHSHLAAQLTPAWLAECAAALEIQARILVGPVWPWAQGATFRVGAGPDDVGEAEIPARILASLPGAPGDVAYHDDASGYPDVFLGLDDCPTLDDVSFALSHEIPCETAADPNCDQWVTVPFAVPGIAAGQQLALEVCDPLQDLSYRIGTILVSDWLLPAYFGLGADPGGPTSYGERAGLAGRLAPFTRTPGGYQLVRNADGGGETQVMGKIADRRARKARMVGSRPHRRGARLP